MGLSLLPPSLAHLLSARDVPTHFITTHSGLGADRLEEAHPLKAAALNLDPKLWMFSANKAMPSDQSSMDTLGSYFDRSTWYPHGPSRHFIVLFEKTGTQREFDVTRDLAQRITRLLLRGGQKPTFLKP